MRSTELRRRRTQLNSLGGASRGFKHGEAVTLSLRGFLNLGGGCCHKLSYIWCGVMKYASALLLLLLSFCTVPLLVAIPVYYCPLQTAAATLCC